MKATRSRAGTVPLIAGRPVLNLVNTISWRGDPARAEDHLQASTDCLTWAARVGVLTSAEAGQLTVHLEREPSAAKALLTGLRELRAAVTEVLIPPTAAGVERLEPLIRAALVHSHLVPDESPAGPRRYHWQVTDLDEHTPTRRLTLDGLDLLTSLHGRVGICADNQCQWAFLDTSHAQNRQWCSSTDCGNRHRARRHHQRHRPLPS